MNKETGGPAFPIADPFIAMKPQTEAEAKLLQGGMTLRDYFAAKAMPIAATFYDTSDEVCNEAAAWCYKMADAMLEARK